MKQIQNFLMLLVVAISYKTISADLNYYLPPEEFNPDIPTPEQTLGYQVGEWHVRHDQMIEYFEILANSSDRVQIKEIGRTHENRKLLQLFISSPEKIASLEEVRTRHLNSISNSNISEQAPLIVNLNYSVHGDESSGSNASLLIAYYLAASNSPKVQEYLNNMVIILDPSLNPDGLSRFAQWVNENKGKNLNADPNNREHVQGWIRGRVNHYWFDLNRDWLLLQHPESQARLKQYHAWRPNVVTDHHEMGTNSTFFFQPGIPSRKNPYTPEQNVELTKELGHYHAKAFDKNKTLYFTEEAFDDFYAGKGSTYPDLTGSVGILFEQASSRGHLQHSINGDLDFPTTIRNQITVTLSTLEGSLANKSKLMTFQNQFEKQALDLAQEDDVKGYLLTEEHDKSRFNKLINLMKKHQIQVFGLTRNVKIGKQIFDADHSVFVPVEQPQYRLIKSIFSEQTSFNDNTFYDVSSWNLPMAFNIEYQAVTSVRNIKLSANEWSSTRNRHDVQLTQGAVAYVIDWRDYEAPKLVYNLLKEGISLRASKQSFSSIVDGSDVIFPAGSIIVNASLQKEDWFKTFSKQALSYNVKISSISSGLTTKGIDLGSRNMKPVQLPKVLVVGGLGVNPYEAGESWFFMDHQLGFSPTIVEKQRLNSIELSNYTHILLVDTWLSKDDKSLVNKLNKWSKDGGVLWAQKRAAIALSKLDILKADVRSSSELKELFNTDKLAYGDKEALSARQRIAGAFFSAQLDKTHPLSFGLTKAEMPLFKNASLVIKQPDEPFSLVAQYSNRPLLSGYADQINVEQIAGSTAMLAQKNSKGVIVAFADNPNFRGITYGSQRLLMNVLFLSNLI